MVLCRRCAHTVYLATLRCPRCGWTFPYLRSRRWTVRKPAAPLALGKECPRCGARTSRRRSPMWMKPLKLLAGSRCTYRRCDVCTWSGPALHGPGRNPRGVRPETE